MPGPLFVSTTQQARHGVFAIEKTSPPQLIPQGTDVACLVGQPDWGPANILTTPATPKDFINMVAPAGVSRSNSFYLSAIRKGFPSLKFVRVMTAAAAVAIAAFPNVTPVSVITVVLKYPGTAGNSFTGTVAAASDGNATHFNLTITVTGTSGTTSETLQNLSYNGVSTTVGDSAPDLSTSLLIGSITKNLATGGRPLNGTVTFSGGTAPNVAASDYTGSQGLGDTGIALCEGDSGVRHLFLDDPGAGLRTAVNAGASAHATYMGERIAYLNGVSGMTLAATQSDASAAAYRTDRVVYCDPWAYVLDEAGVRRLVPSASFAASVASQISPSTAISWKNQEVQKMLQGINGLEADRGQGAGSNTTAGICTFIREEQGGYTMESDVVGMAPVDSTRAHLTRRRITDYIALSFVRNTRGFVDAPNVPQNQQMLVNAVIGLMDDLKANQNRDANHQPHILDYAIGNLQSENSAVSLASGNFSIPLDVQDSAGMYRVFLNMNSGEGVTISHA